MVKLLMLFGISVCLAYCSQKEILKVRLFDRINIDIPLVVMFIMLTLFCGLRTDYNDTLAYNHQFVIAPTLSEYLDTNPGLTDNPLFYGFRNFFKYNIIDNCHAFNIFVSAITNFCFLRLIKKYSMNFPFSIIVFFGVNLYIDTLAGAKQCLALAILTFAIDALINKKVLTFYLLVFVAMLIHTYAVFLIILPIFTNKPWTIITYLTIFCFIIILLTFESSLELFLSTAEDAGKNISEEEIYDNTGINPLRLAIFGIPAILSFLFHDNLDSGYVREKNVFMNMSIISFLVMSLGIFMAANMFGRCAIYFELGSIILLPWIIEQIFDKRTSNLIVIIASVCYVGFFVYDNNGFSDGYCALTFVEFLKTL